MNGEYINKEILLETLDKEVIDLKSKNKQYESVSEEKLEWYIKGFELAKSMIKAF